MNSINSINIKWNAQYNRDSFDTMFCTIKNDRLELDLETLAECCVTLHQCELYDVCCTPLDVFMRLVGNVEVAGQEQLFAAIRNLSKKVKFDENANWPYHDQTAFVLITENGDETKCNAIELFELLRTELEFYFSLFLVQKAKNNKNEDYQLYINF